MYGCEEQNKVYTKTKWMFYQFDIVYMLFCTILYDISLVIRLDFSNGEKKSSIKNIFCYKWITAFKTLTFQSERRF